MTRLIRFFKDKQNWPIVLIPLLLMGWAKFGAPALGLASFESATLYAGPYRDPLPPGPDGEPIVERLVVVVVDGLRVDMSEEMPFLNQLRERGADRVVRAGQPAFSLPGWTVIGTGALQETSGITSNFVERAVEIDTVFAAARRAGLSTGAVGSPEWAQLYGGDLDRFTPIPMDEEEYTDPELTIAGDLAALEAAQDLLAEPPELTLVHFVGVDSAGHGFGGDSPEYRRVALAVDARIQELMGSIDLEQTAVLITSDHGHIDPGGHSGPEPVVLNVPLVTVGAAVRPGAYPPASQADLAPTVATLLGTSIPAHNQGQPLLDELEAPPGVLAARAIDAADQVSARYEAMLEAIGDQGTIDHSTVDAAREAYRDNDYEQAIALSQDAVEAARATWEDARRARLNRERVARGTIALLLLAPAALYLAWWRRSGWNGWIPALGALLYTVLWNGNYHLLQGLTYSTSWFNLESDIQPFLADRVMEAMIALLVVTVLVGVIRRRAGPLKVVRDSVHTLLSVALVLMVQILIFYVLWDVTFEWHLPDFALGFKYYLDVFQTTAFWPLTPLPVAGLLPFVGLGAAWVARKAEGVLASQRHG